MSIRVSALALAALGLAVPLSVHAQPAQAQPDPQALPIVTVCGQQTRPAAQPPAGTGPVVLFIAPCFEAQGNASVIEAQTYLYYIQLKASVPSRADCGRSPWSASTGSPR